MLIALLGASVAALGPIGCKKADSKSGGSVANPPVEAASKAGNQGAAKDTPGQGAAKDTPGEGADKPQDDGAEQSASKAAAPKDGDKPAVRPATKSAAGPVVRSTDTHVVTVKPAAGTGSGSFTVSLEPKPGWKINQDFPTSLQITAPPGVELPKAKLVKGDASTFSEKSAVFNVKFASSSGAKQFSALFKFAMCTEETCDPKKEQLAWSVNVN